MTPRQIVSIGACALIVIGMSFYVWLFTMRLLGMEVEYSGILYASIGFWLGTAFTLCVMYKVIRDDYDKPMDK